MKRTLALGIASLCAIGMARGVFAAEMTGNTQDIPAEYNVDSAYTVTIPAGITFIAADTSVEEIIKAEDVLIKDSETLKISMSSANGRLQNGDSSFINYSFTLGEDEEVTIASGTDYQLLSVEAGEIEGAEKDIVFTAGDLENVNLAGMHSDTLTFKVEVDDGIVFLQDIQSLKSTIFANQQYRMKDARDNKIYTIENIEDTIWMTQDLNYIPEGATWDEDGMISVGEIAYYNWYAASGNSEEDWWARTSDPDESICPSGWRLPNQNDFKTLSETSRWITLYDGMLNGMYNSGAGDIGDSGMGYYWSTHTDNGQIGNRIWGDGYIRTEWDDYNTYDAYPVRCVAL